MAISKMIKSSGYELEIQKQETTEVWNSKRVQEALDAIDNGIPLKSSPFYMKNVNLRKPNLVYDYTQWEADEIAKCANDICYFADTYCMVMTDDGVRKIKLRDYQRAMLKHYANNRFSICLAARQIGKTICSSIFIAWYSLFNFDKNVMIVSNKGETTKEIIDKGKVIFENLPFFLKPGILKWDVMSEKFDNGCRVVGQNTTKRTGISFTIHLLFLDEFAHVDPAFINPFYENLYPTLSSSKISRIIITSTPNGMNKFFDIYTAAESGENDYGAFRVDWWEVPGRDDNWYRQELKNLGSIEAFNRQYGNSFLDENELLLSSDTLKFLEKSKIKFVHHDFSILDDYEIDYRNLLWDPRFDIETIRDDNRYYLFSIDISEGAGGEDPDFSVINIFKLQPLPRKWIEKTNSTNVYDYFGLRQIGRLHDKTLTVGQLAQIAYLLTHHVFDIEHVKILIEWNLFGSELMKDMSTCFPVINDFDESAVLRFKHRKEAKVPEYGLKVKNDNKVIFCQNFKLLTAKHRIEIVDKDTVLEAKTFGKVKNSFKAQVGHDDLMMSSVNASNFFETVEYADFVEEYLDKITPETYNLIMQKMDLQGGMNEDLNNYDIYSLLENKQGNEIR